MKIINLLDKMQHDNLYPLVEKGWIHLQNPRVWFQWYCHYHLGRKLTNKVYGKLNVGEPLKDITVRLLSIVNFMILVVEKNNAKHCSIGHMIREKLILHATHSKWINIDCWSFLVILLTTSINELSIIRSISPWGIEPSKTIEFQEDLII